MGKYVKNKKEMKFESLDALKTVTRVLNEASEAIKDKSRNIRTSAMPEVLAGALGVGIGGGIGFAALYLGGPIVGLNAAGIAGGLAAAGGLIGGGMAAGIAVIAAPAVILGAGAVGVTSHYKNKKLRVTKELCYQEALRKQAAINKALENEKNADKERIEYLTALNELLKAAIKDLKYDLGL